jgi:hypothetical protein
MNKVVAIHNTVNERAWQHILAWEALHACDCANPRLKRFQGKPDEFSPKARLLNFLVGLGSMGVGWWVWSDQTRSDQRRSCKHNQGAKAFVGHSKVLVRGCNVVSPTRLFRMKTYVRDPSRQVVTHVHTLSHLHCHRPPMPTCTILCLSFTHRASSCPLTATTGS